MLIPTRSRSGASPKVRQLGRVLADPERGPDRTLGIVLVGRRDSEHAQDRVADELLHHPAVGLDMAAGHREVHGEHAVDVFGVGSLRGGGEVDEVAEQRRDDLALLGERHGPGCSGAPQPLQNRDPAGFSVPQDAHSTMGVKHRGPRTGPEGGGWPGNGRAGDRAREPHDSGSLHHSAAHAQQGPGYTANGSAAPKARAPPMRHTPTSFVLRKRSASGDGPTGEACSARAAARDGPAPQQQSACLWSSSLAAARVSDRRGL